MAQLNITINQRIYSIDKQCWQNILIERELHVWGKQAEYLAEKAVIGDELILEGKLSYASNATKSQFIEVMKVHLFKN